VPALAKPMDNTLFFASEPTDVTSFTGTVHGAIESGLLRRPRNSRPRTRGMISVKQNEFMHHKPLMMHG
jgi:hypothetical protein